MIQPTNAQQLYPQQGGANAVSINIYNPQAYGGAQAQQPQIPNYTNSLYQMPQASMYQPQVDPMAAYYQQFMPMQNPIAQMPMMPQMFQPQDMMMAQQTQMFPSPAPQIMPGSVMTQPQVQPQVQQPVQPEVQQPVQPEAQAEVQQPTQPEAQVEPSQPQAPQVDTDALVNALKSTDVNAKADAINKIAEHVQDTPEVALQVVSEPVMQGLVDIINEDTSALEGPSEQQIAVAEKVAKGEQLTPEEDALSEQLSPRDAANKNRIFALYTLAMIQKLQKDELEQYSQTQQASGQPAIEPLKVQDLIGYDNIVGVIKNAQERPEVKVAAIQALSHVAGAQDEATVKEALADALNSEDEVVKSAAQEAIDKLALAQGGAQAEAPAQDGAQAEAPAKAA